jgi:hypothetical protein
MQLSSQSPRSTLATSVGVGFRESKRTTRVTAPFLDRLADIELQQGHVARAEYLAHRAAELREVTPCAAF